LTHKSFIAIVQAGGVTMAMIDQLDTPAWAEAVRDACGVGLLADLQGRPSRAILPQALGALARMAHRGAIDADGRSGDGAGVTTQIPFAVLRPEVEALGLPCTPGALAAGLVFLPRDSVGCAAARALIETVLAEHDVPGARWRGVPVDEDALGDTARRSRPMIAHVLVPRPSRLPGQAFEAKLVAARRAIEERAVTAGLHELYVASLSHRTVVYKALVRATDLAACYPDLRHGAYETAFALFHQRFSTNTAPSWSMTQPFRLIAHNGEINTIDGNRRWMDARAPELDAFAVGHQRLGASHNRPGTSDSATLDEALVSLTAAGRGIAHGMTLLVPPAWEHDDELSADVRAFLDYQASIMEPWDGPALVVFADGRVVGAALDRNGLRPARYLVTTAGLVLVSSEVGVLDVAEAEVVMRGRLGPGDLLVVDLESRRILDRETVHEALAARHPYAQWLADGRVTLAQVRTGVMTSAPSNSVADMPAADVRALRTMGVTREELLLILGPMYKEGIEPLGSMGDDSPLAVLSSSDRSLFSYFRQRFAQVTNPPIDSLREALVMSLDVRLGAAAALLTDDPLPGPHILLEHPVLEPADVEAILAWSHPRWRSCRYSLAFSALAGTGGFEWALDALVGRAKAAARAGVSCLVLSDRDVSGASATLPTLLAVGAVHHCLVRAGLRLRTSIVVDAGDARDEHAIAALLAYGADAVCPRIAYAAIAHATEKLAADHADRALAVPRYRQAVIKGLRKILAKMGVSTLRSYRGAGLFEAIGIADEVIAKYFTGTPSAVGGIGLREIAEETLARHRVAFAAGAASLEEGSWHRYRKDGEPHAYEPSVVKALHAAIRTGAKLDYESYARLVHARAPIVLRDLMELRRGNAIAVEEVEPATELVRRFISAAMSLGALSSEAQQTIATAMNRLGARSNSGEGGEPPELFWQSAPGAERASARIKQVASGRFGVTAAYLMSADEIQIKMAQGSKPGEGGQLPGAKVTAHIARVRHAAAGTTLISPPPHHDIYSIEDLGQLIYDLKRVNPAATVSVKLVSSSGIGTIAVGVAKAYADAIQISGHDGGTGASPRGSIKNAGSPWETGLSEAHQALVRGGLRGRVRLQVDGGLKTGRDVVFAALLGAEEYGFGTATLVAAGCVMARQCHLNSCPAGIATQREELRAKFSGTPDDVVRFFMAIAEEVREILALLGVPRLDDVVGRTDLAERRAPSRGKAALVRLDRLLAPQPGQVARHCTQPRNDPPLTGTGIDERVLRELRFIDGRLRPVEMLLPISNADRAVGARVAGQLVELTGGRGVAPRTVQLHLRGSAGQSFGAFCVNGMRLTLDGEANDYVGKGMSGGEIIVRPSAGARHDGRQVIAGNTLLYGATGGVAFIAGRVGERFAVRNSGALAVVEGTGDHAGEYMTAGGVLILGPTGRNVGAGMTGGVLFALDADGALARRTHREWVDGGSALTPAEDAWVLELITRHAQATYSRIAEQLLNDWEQRRHQFRRVSPVAAVSDGRPLPALSPELGRADHRPPAPAAIRAVSGMGSRSGSSAPASTAPPP
jgi:glutamate synthase domain-containing protein 2/glutamate synthase domain-containing protein 1/glutamate synthase domain-containing protein 3